jgi:hypothetical protein
MGTHVPGQYRVPVWRGSLYAQRSGCAARSNDALHLDLLAQRAGHVVGNDARECVAWTASGIRHEDRDCAIRVINFIGAWLGSAKQSAHGRNKDYR